MNHLSHKNLKSDIPASIVVFFVALLCLGIALASGAPLFSGLIAVIVGGIVVGAFSGSAIGVSGPTAGLAAIVLVAISTLGGFENFLLAVVLGGIIQVAGVLKQELLLLPVICHQRNAYRYWDNYCYKTNFIFWF